MGTKLMKKMVAMVVALAMIMTSGLAVFAAEQSPKGDSTPTPAATKITEAAKDVTSTGNYSKKTLKVYWGAVSGAESYNVYLNGKLWASKVSGTSTTLTGLKANAKYDITVEAVNSAGNGPQTKAVNMTLSKRWVKTTKITKITKGKKKATVKWKKVKGATGYQVLYSKDGKTWKTKYIKGGKKTKATIKKLKKGKWYFKVRPVKGKYLGIRSGKKSVKVK